MSDSELRNYINRMQMERQYAQLTATEVSPGKKFVKEVIELVYCSCKNHMWDYMGMHDYDAIDAIYKDIKDDLSIELD